MKQDATDVHASLGGLASSISEAMRSSAQDVEHSLGNLSTATTAGDPRRARRTPNAR